MNNPTQWIKFIAMGTWSIVLLGSCLMFVIDKGWIRGIWVLTVVVAIQQMADWADQ